MSTPFNPNPSPLNNLTPEQSDQLFSWLETHDVPEVLKLIARPAPDGFGIATHDTTLRRSHRCEKLARRPADLQLAQEVVSNSPGTELFDQATAATLRHVAFELTNSPRVSAKAFKAVARWILKLRDQEHQARQLELEKQRLALETKKFEFNAARQAICHLPELMEIVKDPQKDDEDKIRAAREKLFGSAP